MHYRSELVSTITFTASPASYLQYAFFVDDSLRQLSNSNTFSTGVQFGDSIRVFGFNGTCFSGSSPTLYEHTPPPPTINSSILNDTICSGELVTFTAVPSNYDEYYFYVGGSSQQSTPSNTYNTTTLQDSSTVSVVVEERGCFNYFQGNTITIIVKPTPQMDLSASDSVICQGTSVTFTAIATQAATDSFIFLLIR